MRNTWKGGDHLVVDDISGFTHYRSEMAYDWDGSLRHRNNLDGRHPQLDVKARRDPAALTDVRTKQDSDSPGDFFVQEDGMFKFILEDSSGSNVDFLLTENVTVR